MFIIYVEWMSAPKKQYTDLQEAEKEAKRLIKQERRNVYIAELVKWFEIDIKEIDLTKKDWL